MAVQMVAAIAPIAAIYQLPDSLPSSLVLVGRLRDVIAAV